MDSAPRYEIKSRLGSGGTGHVFKAWDTHLQRYIALKRLRTGDPDNSADSLERIRREAMAMASTQHPNIVTIYDFGCDQDGPFVAMEFVDGETLAAVAEREWFDLKQFAELVTQTLGALAAAHHVNVLHRDLKPQNIMVTRLPTGQRQYKILDFGLARISSQALPQTMDKNEAICGTAHYLAPEQFSRQPLDGRTDLYALGCAYYYVLTHQMPFNGNNVTAVINAHLAHTVTPLAALRQDLPPEICNWVMRLFSRKPEDRPLSAAIALEQFVRLCRQLASGETLVPDKLTRRTQTYLAEKFAAADSEAQFATRPYTTAMTAPGFSRGGKRLLLLALLGAIIVALGWWGLALFREPAPEPVNLAQPAPARPQAPEGPFRPNRPPKPYPPPPPIGVPAAMPPRGIKGDVVRVEAKHDLLVMVLSRPRGEPTFVLMPRSVDAETRTRALVGQPVIITNGVVTRFDDRWEVKVLSPNDVAPFAAFRQ